MHMTASVSFFNVLSFRSIVNWFRITFNDGVNIVWALLYMANSSRHLYVILCPVGACFDSIRPNDLHISPFSFQQQPPQPTRPAYMGPRRTASPSSNPSSVSMYGQTSPGMFGPGRPGNPMAGQYPMTPQQYYGSYIPPSQVRGFYYHICVEFFVNFSVFLFEDVLENVSITRDIFFQVWLYPKLIKQGFTELLSFLSCNPCSKLVLGNIKNRMSSSVISQHWDGTGCWNSPRWKTRICLSCIYSIPWLMMTWWHKETGYQQP